MEIVRASELGEGVREELSRLFSEGFGHWLRFFSTDTAVLSRTFQHMFLLEQFYVALIDGHIAGMAACTDGKTAPVRLDKAALKKHLGLFKGTIAARVLKPYMEKLPYPFPLDEGTATIEDVCTSAPYRRQGVAGAIIRHIIDNTAYTSYVLSVADTNKGAVRLYESLGFRELRRVKDKHPRQSGIRDHIIMGYDKR